MSELDGQISISLDSHLLDLFRQWQQTRKEIGEAKAVLVRKPLSDYDEDNPSPEDQRFDDLCTRLSALDATIVERITDALIAKGTIQ